MKRKNVKFIEEFDPVRKRKISIKSRSLSGIIPSSKNENGIWFESALERDFALILENNPDVLHYQEQPIILKYFNEGRTRTYTPDFYVEFSEECGLKPWLCEIKYRGEFREKFSKLKPKFKAAKDYCINQGWEFKLFSEINIRTSFLENIKFFERYNYNDLDGACYKLMIRTISDLGHTSPKEFMLTVQGAEYKTRGRCLFALWYGIKIGDIGCDVVNAKVSMNSEIWITDKLVFRNR